MAKDAAGLREKALRLGRSAFDNREANRVAKLAAAAGRAESVLFRLICGDPHDLGLCSAFGEIASVHSHAASAVRIKGLAYMPIALARAALWARDRADPSDGEPRNVPLAIRESAPETAFPSFDGGARDLSPQTRLIAAADARLQLAHLLAKYRPSRDANAMTTDQLNRTLLSREKFFRSDEELLYHCHTRAGVTLEAAAEAQMLAEEAVETYQAVAIELDSRGEDPRFAQSVARAEERLQAIRQLIP